VTFVTLGCRVNQYDSQALKERGGEVSFQSVPFSEGADLVVINSCTVTAAAESDMKYWVRRAKRLRPSSVVVVTGCMVKDPAVLFEGVDLVVSQSEKSILFEKVTSFLNASKNAGDGGSSSPTDPWVGGISGFEGHRRAIVKVQDGCRFACSYCAVPSARGNPVSRPLAEILREGRRLAEGGVHELVLAGVHLSSYGRDLGKKTGDARLTPVVEGLLAIPGIRRIRLSSYGVVDFEVSLLSLLGQGLCPHFHLPLQSGDPSVLQSMRRPYLLEHFKETVDRIRSHVPDAGITTDLIVGFPGEDENAFEHTLRMVEELDFLDFHPFPFSERPGTAAVEMVPKVSFDVLRARMTRLKELKKRRTEEMAKRHIGQVVEVVAEQYKKGLLGGTTDRGWKLAFPKGNQAPGQELRVRLVGFEGDRSIGEVL
jgi:threonylcarbamoyladenosine tRNA methylthiotransferase MtaB